MTTNEYSLNNIALGQYHSLKPARYSRIQRMELRQTDENDGRGPIAYIDLVLGSEHQEATRLYLSFSGVLNVRLTPPPRMLLSLSLLTISDVRDRQWEGVSYEVKETEHDTLSFLCRDFAASIK